MQSEDPEEAARGGQKAREAGDRQRRIERGSLTSGVY